MEAGDGDATPGVRWAQASGRAPGSFLGLVTFLERLTAGATRVGGDGPPHREAIRFRHDPDLAFHAADVSDLQVLEDPTRFEVVTAFLGLSGSVSPLPAHIPEGVLYDTFEESTQRDFLDVFHHRAVSLFFRAVVRLDPAREHRSDATDPWLQRLLAMSGIPANSALALEPGDLMVLAPILLKRARGASALRAAVFGVLRHDLPHVHVAVRELVGHWIGVDPDQYTRIGRANHVLGVSTMVGRRVYDQRGRFAIRLATLTRDEADGFREDGRLLDRLRAAVSLVLREPLSYDLELELGPGATRYLRLGSSRLGTGRLAGFEGTEVLVKRNVGKDLGVNRSLI